jgi:hypothetical protein
MATKLNISDNPIDIGIGIEMETFQMTDCYQENVVVSSTNPRTTPETKLIKHKQSIKEPIKYTPINGWTPKNQTYFKYCLYRLKYYRIINNFFFFELKKREGKLSWIIIVFSSFSSVLSLINTQQELFMFSSNLVKWVLVLITLVITLISAYIKKQQFIDRINNIDRYLQQLNQTVEELNITFILEPEKRESYDEFCKKYIPIIKNLSVSPASFSPTEWKRIVYTITTYYPELIQGDGTNGELLWPWFYMDNEQSERSNENKRRHESKFGEHIISSYDYLKSKKWGYSFLHCCKKPTFTIVHDTNANHDSSLNHESNSNV